MLESRTLTRKTAARVQGSHRCLLVMQSQAGIPEDQCGVQKESSSRQAASEGQGSVPVQSPPRLVALLRPQGEECVGRSLMQCPVPGTGQEQKRGGKEGGIQAEGRAHTNMTLV